MGSRAARFGSPMSPEPPPTRPWITLCGCISSWPGGELKWDGAGRVWPPKLADDPGPDAKFTYAKAVENSVAEYGKTAGLTMLFIPEARLASYSAFACPLNCGCRNGRGSARAEADWFV